MSDMKPLTLQEFFQALADDEWVFEFSQNKIEYDGADTFRTLLPNGLPGGQFFSFSLIRAYVTLGQVYLYEEPKRLLTPDDVGRPVKLESGDISIIEYCETQLLRFTINGYGSYYKNNGTTIFESDAMVTHIRNDKGEWEEIG